MNVKKETRSGDVIQITKSDMSKFAVGSQWLVKKRFYKDNDVLQYIIVTKLLSNNKQDDEVCKIFDKGNIQWKKVGSYESTQIIVESLENVKTQE